MNPFAALLRGYSHCILAIRLLLFLPAVGFLPAQTLPDASPESVPTVVTVSARATPLSDTAGSVTVLTRADIETSHAQSAAELLRTAPFLQIAQPGGPGG